jgi:hypothetical protein
MYSSDISVDLKKSILYDTKWTTYVDDVKTLLQSNLSGKFNLQVTSTADILQFAAASVVHCINGMLIAKYFIVPNCWAYLCKS